MIYPTLKKTKAEIDVLSHDFKSEGISAQTQPMVRDHGNYAPSQLNTNKALSAITINSVDKESRAVSVMTNRGPKRYDMAASAKTLTVQSQREKIEQVSEGRFLPMIFDANVQTDRELLVNYLRPETAEIEIDTDPVKFAEEKEFIQCMIQTDPVMPEPELTHEPESLEQPLDSQNLVSDILLEI